MKKQPSYRRKGLWKEPYDSATAQALKATRIGPRFVVLPGDRGLRARFEFAF